MAAINEWTMIGTIVEKPRIIQGKSSKIASFRLCVQDSWADKITGEQKVKRNYFRITSFANEITEVLESLCDKGTSVFVRCKPSNEKYTTKDGEERWEITGKINNGLGTLMILAGAKRFEDTPQDLSLPQDTELPDEQLQEMTTDLDDDIPF